MTLTITKKRATMCSIITGLALMAYVVMAIMSFTQPSITEYATVSAVLAGVMLISYMLKTFYKNNFAVDVPVISVIMIMFVVPFGQILLNSVQAI